MKSRWLTSEDIKFLKDLGRKQVIDGIVDINPSEYEEVFVMIDNAICYLSNKGVFDSYEYSGLLQLHSDLKFILNDEYAFSNFSSNKAAVEESLVNEQEAIKRLFG